MVCFLRMGCLKGDLLQREALIYTAYIRGEDEFYYSEGCSTVPIFPVLQSESFCSDFAKTSPAYHASHHHDASAQLYEPCQPVYALARSL